MELSTLDQLFATTFLVMGLISAAVMIVLSTRLQNYDTHAVRNCYITQIAIAAFFVLMLAPAAGFAFKGLTLTAASTMAMAGVCAFGLTRLSNRARQILMQRYY